MAVPKRKISSHRQGRRRATHRVTLPEISQCIHCGSDKRPHYLCPSCGKSGIIKKPAKIKPAKTEIVKKVKKLVGSKKTK